MCFKARSSDSRTLLSRLNKTGRFASLLGAPWSEGFPKDFQKVLYKSVDKEPLQETRLRRNRQYLDGLQAQGDGLDSRCQPQAHLTSRMHQSTCSMENQESQPLRAGRQ